MGLKFGKTEKFKSIFRFAAYAITSLHGPTLFAVDPVCSLSYQICLCIYRLLNLFGHLYIYVNLRQRFAYCVFAYVLFDDVSIIVRCFVSFG